MNDLLVKGFLMAGLRCINEPQVFPVWVKSENLEQSEAFLEFLYQRADGKDAGNGRVRQSLRKRIAKAFQLKKLQMDS